MRAAFVGRDEVVQRGADATRATDQTGLPVGPTALTFSGVTKDTDAMWASAQPTRLTAPVQGWYVCSGGVVCNWDGVASDPGWEVFLLIRRNGTNAIAANNTYSPVTGNMYINVARVIWFDTGDYIQLLLGHNRGSRDMKVFGGLLYSPQLSMVRYP